MRPSALRQLRRPFWPIVSVPQAFNEDDLYVDLRSIIGHQLFLKCEGFNFAGSIKLKAAPEMVEAAERDGRLTPESILVESSSGNLGVALSMLAASKGYRFLCVTDSRCNLPTRLLMEALGSQVHIITEPDTKSGFLGARLNYLRALCDSDDRYVWLDQYTNPGDRLLDAVATLARRAGVGAEPAGAAALAGLERAIDDGLAGRSETVVLLVTGREVKVGGAPTDLGRVAVVDTLDEVERALAGDR